MSIKFSHEEKFGHIKQHLPFFLIRDLKKYYKIEVEITINEVSPRNKTGSGGREMLIYRNEILINNISVPLTYTEDASGKLTIIIGKKKAVSVELTGRLNSELVKQLANAVKDYIERLP